MQTVVNAKSTSSSGKGAPTIHNVKVSIIPLSISEKLRLFVITGVTDSRAGLGFGEGRIGALTNGTPY